MVLVQVLPERSAESIYEEGRAQARREIEAETSAEIARLKALAEREVDARKALEQQVFQEVNAQRERANDEVQKRKKLRVWRRTS